MESLNFKPHQDGFYMSKIGNVEIWIKTKIIVCEYRECVELCDYSYERLEKLISIFAV